MNKKLEDLEEELRDTIDKMIKELEKEPNKDPRDETVRDYVMGTVNYILYDFAVDDTDTQWPE